MRRHAQWTNALILILTVSLVAMASCSDSGTDNPSDDQDASAGSCSFSFECGSGLVCAESRCVDPNALEDAGSDAEVAEDSVDDGEDLDGSELDEDDTADVDDIVDVPDTRVTFAPDQYRRCTDSLDCAVFGGNCITELALSRADENGDDRVAISDLDSSFAEDEGVCTSSCTNDPRACASIVVEGPGGEEAPFRCQMIYHGTNPYLAPALPLPFDDTLDLVAMARGVPFASICRPPFELAEAHSRSFCSPCESDDQCAEGDICFAERPFASTPSGSCIQSCVEQADCPFGFTCDAIDGDNFCVPTGGVCGRCLDEDGDQRGVGRCGPLEEPVTAVDCDDSDPMVYFSSDDPNHAFPEMCGDFDYNCNGLSDRAEQLGSSAHCAECGDVCEGIAEDIPNAEPTCVARDEAENGYTCVASCQSGFADCDNDLSTGCEAELGANQQWYRDGDGDGRGDPDNVKYFCDGNADEGWVQNTLDCDDGDSLVYGGDDNLDAAPELCDGLDNDCNRAVDDNVVGAGDTCSSGFDGICAAGTFACRDTETEEPTLACVPTVEPADVVDAFDACNGYDDNCDGHIDEDADYTEETGNPTECTIAGGLGICAGGTRQCEAIPTVDPYPTPRAAWRCIANEPESVDWIDDELEDANCDGSDGNLSRAIFVARAGEGSLDGNDSNPGTSQQPVATIQRALNLLAEKDASYDIYVADGVFASSEEILVPGIAPLDDRPAVRIYGGFESTVVCDEQDSSCTLDWRRDPTAQSTIVRDAPPIGDRGDGEAPFGPAYRAIGGDETTPIELLLHGIRLEVKAPSTFLENGEDAPTQVGLQCGEAGCAKLEFVNTAVVVENALDGGMGVSAEAAATPSGAVNNDGPDGRKLNDSNPVYGSRAIALEAVERGLAAECTTGGAHHGGRPGGFRWGPASVLGWDYTQLIGMKGDGGGADQASGGVYVNNIRGVEGYPNNAQISYSVERGCDGAVGDAGSFTAEGDPAIERFDDMYYLSRFSEVPAEPGLSGSGGGGGGGCLLNYPTSPCGGGFLPPCPPAYGQSWGCPPNGPDSRLLGGAGGAGGCAGLPGGNGGAGGSAIGLWLIAPQSDSLSMTAEEGELVVTVGAAGSGGDGAPGGNGAAGGYGGSVGPIAGVTYDKWQGGNGGDGGGGGAGAGAPGGNSLGLVIMARSQDTSSEFQLPGLLTSRPDAYISTSSGGEGGASAANGDMGEKPPRAGMSDTRRSCGNDASDGGSDPGEPGFAQQIFTTHLSPQ